MKAFSRLVSLRRSKRKAKHTLTPWYTKRCRKRLGRQGFRFFKDNKIIVKRMTAGDYGRGHVVYAGASLGLWVPTLHAKNSVGPQNPKRDLGSAHARWGPK